ncbi:MAG: hypothetical protein M3680_34605, partial [Myxococcota bacterium]|nr:hypothetical protein [Myxococcota bacterium]
MRTRGVLLLAVLGGCAISEAKPAPAVTVEIAGVSLGDDCAPPPPATPKPTKLASPAKRAPPASPA